MIPTVLFQIFDLDGNGYLDKKEIRQIIQAQVSTLHEDLLGEEDQQMLATVNWKDLVEQLIETTVEEIFEEVDANGDGEISLDEWLQALTFSPALRLWGASIQACRLLSFHVTLFLHHLYKKKPHSDAVLVMFSWC